jgi:protoporphyrinogen oxidase
MPSSRFADDRPVLIIGAGPAGLTAADELVSRGEPVIVCEHDTQVGGLSRTVVSDGFRFDIGGHRFYTKSARVEAKWREVLGADLLRRPRLSRVHYGGAFFDYPLKPLNVVLGLGAVGSLRVILSYLWIWCRPIRPEVSFADWVTNRFGRRLYSIFFESYTEKVWGIPPRTISADWAAQRIRSLSFAAAVRGMFRSASGGGTIKTLIEEFDYPRLGPGMMWEAMAARVAAGGGRIHLASTVTALHHAGGRIASVEIDRNGARQTVPVGHVISTMAIRDLVNALVPAAPAAVTAAANRLKYRDFLTVALVLDADDLFPDNWIYIHDRRVKVGRIQNFKNWSPDMVPDPRCTCLGLEYFCFEGDGIWSMSDDDLIGLAMRELRLLGLAGESRVIRGAVARARKAYPVYDGGYAGALAEARAFLETFANLQLVGRNGMHKYNNQDHSMLTAMFAVENLFGATHDIWALNTDDEHVEDGASGERTPLRDIAATQPAVPRPVGSHRDR